MDHLPLASPNSRSPLATSVHETPLSRLAQPPSEPQDTFPADSNSDSDSVVFVREDPPLLSHSHGSFAMEEDVGPDSDDHDDGDNLILDPSSFAPPPPPTVSRHWIHDSDSDNDNDDDDDASASHGHGYPQDHNDVSPSHSAGGSYSSTSSRSRSAHSSGDDDDDDDDDPYSSHPYHHHHSGGKSAPIRSAYGGKGKGGGGKGKGKGGYGYYAPPGTDQGGGGRGKGGYAGKGYRPAMGKAPSRKMPTKAPPRGKYPAASTAYAQKGVYGHEDEEQDEIEDDDDDDEQDAEDDDRASAEGEGSDADANDLGITRREVMYLSDTTSNDSEQPSDLNPAHPYYASSRVSLTAAAPLPLLPPSSSRVIESYTLSSSSSESPAPHAMPPPVQPLPPQRASPAYRSDSDSDDEEDDDEDDGASGLGQVVEVLLHGAPVVQSPTAPAPSFQSLPLPRQDNGRFVEIGNPGDEDEDDEVEDEEDDDLDSRDDLESDDGQGQSDKDEDDANDDAMDQEQAPGSSGWYPEGHPMMGSADPLRPSRKRQRSFSSDPGELGSDDDLPGATGDLVDWSLDSDEPESKRPRPL